MRRFLWAACLVLVSGCAATAPAGPASGPPRAPAGQIAAGDVTFTILHFNDVYEITPVEGGRAGGLARVATLRHRLLAADPHTLTVLAGDFFSPSALGTARVDGARLNGRQMVAVLNAVGVDVAALGNHGFDVSEADFERGSPSRTSPTSRPTSRRPPRARLSRTSRRASCCRSCSPPATRCASAS